MQNVGSIHIIKGPMFSGKTSELLRRYRTQRRSHSKKTHVSNILLIRYEKDLRYSSDGLSTHDQIIECDARAVGDLSKIEEQVASCSHVYIDEGQFFENLKEYCVRWAKQGKEVHIACLDGYGNQRHDPWPEIVALEPWAIENIKLCAVCSKCGGLASLTLTLDGSEEPSEKIGGSETYEARCIHCCDP